MAKGLTYWHGCRYWDHHQNDQGSNGVESCIATMPMRSGPGLPMRMRIGTQGHAAGGTVDPGAWFLNYDNP